MKIMAKIAVVAIVASAGIFAAPLVTLADGHTTVGGQAITLPNPLGSASTPIQLLERILTYLLQLGGILGAIMIIIGAFQILFAAGDPEKFITGRRTIVYTAIAYAILLMARGIVAIIENFLTGTP